MTDALDELSTTVVFCAVNKVTVPVNKAAAPAPVAPTVVVVNGVVLGVNALVYNACPLVTLILDIYPDNNCPPRLLPPI